MKLFLDTSVLIDYYASREPYCPFFAKLQAMQIFGDAELWVSAKSFADVFLLCKEYVAASDLQDAFAASSEFLDICSVSAEDILDASRRKWENFDACLIAIAAEKVKADYLLTRDKAGFSQSKATVVSPLELLEELERQGYIYDEVPL